jgi:hypothetical protein
MWLTILGVVTFPCSCGVTRAIQGQGLGRKLSNHFNNTRTKINKINNHFNFFCSPRSKLVVECDYNNKSTIKSKDNNSHKQMIINLTMQIYLLCSTIVEISL